MFHNDVPRMRYFLSKLLETGLEQELEAEVISANLLIDRLESKRRKSLVEIKNVVHKPDIGEIKTYGAPPQAVKEVLTAVLVILGYK